jgi:anti-sigma-K factor RskA
MFADAHVLELIPAYVLGSLEEEEARLVKEHMAGCYLCRKELDVYQAVADQLSLAVPEAAPSAELKPRLMERIQSLKMKRATPSTGWRFAKQLVPLGAFAALGLIILLAFSNLLLWQKIRDMDVLTGPHGMRAIALQNTGRALEASGFVIVGADGQNGVLVVDKLPALDATREYQVWLTRDGSDTSGAVFSVDESGYRGVRLTPPESLLLYTSVQVTIEPAGGSERPTGSQVLIGSLANQ